MLEIALHLPLHFAGNQKLFRKIKSIGEEGGRRQHPPVAKADHENDSGSFYTSPEVRESDRERSTDIRRRGQEGLVWGRSDHGHGDQPRAGLHEETTRAPRHCAPAEGINYNSQV